MEITDVDGIKEKKRRRLTQTDYQHIADYLVSTFSDRKHRRRHLEHEWSEIDRQIRMEPDLGYKMVNQTIPDYMAWLPETELPLQAQALEVLNADARRLMSPLNANWFTAHSAMTDKYLDKVEFSSLIAGDENDVPSVITQDNADKLVQGAINHWNNQYDFWGHIDLINSDAFKYGLGVGVARMVKKSVVKIQGKGAMRKDEMIPMLIPRSVKKTYVDDNFHAVCNEGIMIGGMQLYCYHQRFDDLVLAANSGSTDPDSITGGWMPKNLKGLETEDGEVTIIEGEGDFVIPRKTSGSMVIPNAIFTVAQSGYGDKTTSRVVRVRLLKYGCSHIFFPYHRENVDNPYPTSPLMLGCSVQKAAVDALNRYLMAAALHATPPVSYDRDDQQFAQEGGPRIYPFAQWASTSEVRQHIFGNPQPLFAAYAGFLQQYADVTGVNASRLGAQTISHTTAFAKQAELQRSTIRTVDYVNATLTGPMDQWLSKCYEMGRDNTKDMTVYLNTYNGYVNINKNTLPEMVEFEVYGSGGPAEESQKQQRRFSAIQLVMQIDQLETQAKTMGLPETLDYRNMKQQILSDAGWTDVDVILRGETPDQGASPQPDMGELNPQNIDTAPGAALQALALAGQQQS
ncbi:MAG TPA: hypothetical protein DCL39_15970 [Alteromonas macleodii]|nr:hypothetical protein [Alteromonas macleodii]HAM18063.1 hypothetical protein [Alteromonas macleodii]HAX27878.1 hypothetical protein [Alteromonas macleodii]|tara:strand:- start:2143 stop:4026 length:1884 start_codon:yes stop_codon:yes gene_type:complete